MVRDSRGATLLFSYDANSFCHVVHEIVGVCLLHSALFRGPVLRIAAGRRSVRQSLSFGPISLDRSEGRRNFKSGRNILRRLIFEQINVTENNEMSNRRRLVIDSVQISLRGSTGIPYCKGTARYLSGHICIVL